MSEQTETLCDVWEGERVEERFHSRLYHLEPIGVGSPMVESLTGYIMRLAEVHSVYPCVLVSKEVPPLLNLPYLYKNGRLDSGRLTTLWQGSPALNGPSSITYRMVHALEQLTERHDLHFLTMLTFMEVFSHKSLLRRTRAWCPACYEEWRETDQAIYDPLLWALECVSSCPWHCELLHQRCPNTDCGRTSPPLTSRSQPGYCAWCDQWLGSASQPKADSPDEPREEWTWQLWVAKTVGDLLAAAPYFSTRPSRERFTTVISEYINKVAKGNISALARRLQMPRMNVWRWQQGQNMPELGTFVRICAYLEASPLYWLTEEYKEAQTIQKHVPPPSVVSGRRLRRMNVQELQSTLEAILQHEVDPPPSISKISQRLGYDPSVLWKGFPDLCRAISARYSDYQTKKGIERLQRKCDAVRHAMYTLHAQGCYPSQRQIGRLLGSRARLREPVAYNTWKETLRELGW